MEALDGGQLARVFDRFSRPRPRTGAQQQRPRCDTLVLVGGQRSDAQRLDGIGDAVPFGWNPALLEIWSRIEERRDKVILRQPAKQAEAGCAGAGVEQAAVAR